MLASVPIDGYGFADAPVLYRELRTNPIATFNERAVVMHQVDMDTLLLRLRPAMAEVLAKRDALGLAEELEPHFDMFVSLFCSGLLTLYHQWERSDSELPMEELATLSGTAMTGGIVAVFKTARSLGAGNRA